MSIRLEARNRGNIRLDMDNASLAAKYVREAGAAEKAAELSAANAAGAAERADAAAEAALRAEAGAQSAAVHLPQPGENGTWLVWDQAGDSYVDSGENCTGVQGERGLKGDTGDKGDKGDTGSKGDDGVSPTVTVTDITGGHRVTITDTNHPQGQPFDVMDGEVAHEDFDELSGDVDDLKSQINTLQSNCAPVIINSASGNIASFSDGADGLPINALSVNIDPIQAGSGVPSPGNVRPISGRTSATVTWTGKNLCNTIDYSTTVNGVTATKNQDGTFSLSGTATDVTDIQIAFNLFFPAGEYVFNGGVDGLNGTGNTLYLTIRNRNGGSPRFIGNKTKTEFTHFSLEDGEYISYVFIRIANGTNTDGYSIAPMICFVNEDDPTYRPYAGNTYIFQLGNTVYGGDLDVTGGKMVVTMAIVDLGTLTWGYNTANAFFYATKAGIKTYANNETPNWVCSSFSTGVALFPASMVSVSDMSIRPRANADQIQVKDTEYTDAAAFKTAMSGVQLCYELATPLEITLTPTQINTLLGANNTWSDAGTVDVEYRADTKLYIDNIHKPTEDDMTANAQILSGRYFLIGGALYRSTATIPAGDTIRPGTNCVQTNLAEALNALNT